MRRSATLVLIVVTSAIAAACGGSSATSAPDGVAAATDAVGAPADATQPASGGTVQAVTIADALYMTGSAHVEVSGGKQLTLDAPLVPGASMTTGGGTLLAYSSGEGENTSVFSIANGGDGGMAFTITAPGVITGGDLASGCPIELTKNDASGVEGRFDCQGIATVGLDQATIERQGDLQRCQMSAVLAEAYSQGSGSRIGRRALSSSPSVSSPPARRVWTKA